MAYNENGFVRLPPDSTGKRSAAAARLIIDCENNTTFTFQRGQTITGQTSGATAEIIGIHIEGLDAGDVELYCDIATLTGTFSAGENILVDGVVYARIKATATLDQIYYQKNVLVDRDDVDRTLKIGEYGSAYVRFQEGSPHMSLFGGLITENPEVIRQYVYAYDGLDEEFYAESGGGGSISYVPNERSVIFDTNSTASGAYARRTSHLYHPYQPGYATEINQTVVVGDVGKSNVVRRWGFYDDNDGLFWELDGTTLYVVQRSSSIGSGVTDTRVAQTSWNGDRLDGSESFDLNVDKANVYWIDFQWLGAGISRFGIYDDVGNRLTAHSFQNPNTLTTSYMKQGTLPLRYEVQNTGTASSSSELKSICAIVKNVGKTNRPTKSRSAFAKIPLSITSASGELPILSMRAKDTINSINNKVLSFLEEVHVAGEGTGHYIFRLRRGLFLQGESWQSPEALSSAVEYDVSSTGISPIFSGEILYSAIVSMGSNYHHNFFSANDNYQDEIGMFRLADNTTGPIISVTVEAIGSSSGNVYSTANWKEVWL